MALGDLTLPSSLSGGRFRQLRRYLAYRPDEEERFFTTLGLCLHWTGAIHLLVERAQEIGLYWYSGQAGWIRPGLPPLSMITSISVVPYGKPGKTKWPLICAKGKGFEVDFVSISTAHLLIACSHQRERDKMLLRAILSGGVWNGFC